jgi:hypothetical protein
MILDQYNRLGPGTYMVGAQIEDLGVICVMKGRKPMVRCAASTILLGPAKFIVAL